ncbi:MAG: A/G-specific adenine glycosylase [Defluviitaleaceae bacterium]|nr:A/G-specific adenine glycosylase [Defluviitaleaceae bacterium]
MIQQALLNWYAQNKRDLPWRVTKNPYHIWVSEIMAQQTQIATLLPYYIRFVAAFPTVEALAAASMDDVLKICAGIGYYNRFHNMKKAADIMVRDFGGWVPADPKTLQKLPGIGAYAAGAIASIAYGVKVPAVDGNVLRVMARLDRNHGDIAKAATKNALTKRLQAIIPDNPGDFNQALMELGALVCKPQNPLCDQCPIRDFCKGQDIWEQLPNKPAKNPVRDVDKTILLVRYQDSVLMRKRTERLLHGLWEFYHVDGALDESAVAAHLQGLGYTCGPVTLLGEATHVFTHLKWKMTGFACEVGEGMTVGDYVFVLLEDVKGLATPSALRYFVESVK